MKRTLVAQCAAALLTGAVFAGANAAVVGPTGSPAIDGINAATSLSNNTDGLGHILLVPYYSVQNGNDTYLSITNNDMRNGKAVKIRFRGASNSDDVFDFTLLMSPGDVWTAAVSKDAATGLPKLTTGDKSCTLPNAISGQTFVTGRLASYWTADQKANETREGYIEILNMADIYPGAVPAPAVGDPPPTRVNAVAPAVNNPLFTAVKHVNGTPPGCAETASHMVALFTDPTDYNLTGGGAVAKGLDVPTGALSATWTIINVPAASAFSGNADAVEARVGAIPGYGNIVLSPQAATPVTVANARLWTADPLLRGAVLADNELTGAPVLPTAATSYVTPAQYDFPDLSTPYLFADLGALANGVATKRQAARLTSAFAVTSVANEFVTEASLLGKTDWVFSAATRRYNVARNYGTTATAATTVFTSYILDDANGAIAGTLNYYAPTNTTAESGQICVSGISTAAGATTNNTLARTTAVTGDREEAFLGSTSQFVISPGTPAAPLTICGEASVLTINNASGTGVLGASVAKKDITSAYVNGWMRIATPGIAGNRGLPIVGAAFMQLTNNQAAAGTSGNYGIQFPHRNTRY
jgi:hypothetical protein